MLPNKKEETIDWVSLINTNVCPEGEESSRYGIMHRMILFSIKCHFRGNNYAVHREFILSISFDKKNKKFSLLRKYYYDVLFPRLFDQKKHKPFICWIVILYRTLIVGIAFRRSFYIKSICFLGNNEITHN